MTIQTLTDISVKPRVLIADDSRIVRATLIKHIEGMFEFREALDGEQAWEMLLLDPGIRVVITDLTMPKLDGYGLLRRIRNSKVSRIRDIPVVVVSGSDEEQERRRAREAGATDLITKGIGTAQLLSRLDILSRLVTTQRDFERSLEALARKAPAAPECELEPLQSYREQAAAVLAAAVKNGRNFVLLNVRVGVRQADSEGAATVPPAAVAEAIARLLQATVRESDYVARTGEAEFAVATGSINFDAARIFAERVCRAIVSANLVPDERLALVASCGLAALSEDASPVLKPKLEKLCEIAQRRSRLGLKHAITGVVGKEEETLLQQDGGWHANEETPRRGTEAGEDGVPELATLLQWIKEGRRDEVLPHIGKFAAELRPLVDLVLQHGKS